MERFLPVLALGIRTLVGTLLSLALGMVGVGMGWILFVFFGGTAHSTLLIMMLGGAALGAASGSFLAWIRLDHNTLPYLVGTGVVLLVAGVTGAWGGFQFGADQEVPCCAGPDITPMTYTVLGAVAVSNSVALLWGVVQALRRVTIQRPAARPGPMRR